MSAEGCEPLAFRSGPAPPAASEEGFEPLAFASGVGCPAQLELSGAQHHLSCDRYMRRFAPPRGARRGIRTGLQPSDLEWGSKRSQHHLGCDQKAGRSSPLLRSPPMSGGYMKVTSNPLLRSTTCTLQPRAPRACTVPRTARDESRRNRCGALARQWPRLSCTDRSLLSVRT